MQREENAACACNTSEFKTSDMHMIESNTSDATAPFSIALTEKKGMAGRTSTNLTTQRVLGSASKKTLVDNSSKPVNSNEKTPLAKPLACSAHPLKKRPKKSGIAGCGGLPFTDFYQ